MFNLHCLPDRFPAKADGVGLADAGQNRDIVELVNRMFKTQPFDMPPGIDIDDRQARAGGGLFGLLCRVKRQACDGLMVPGGRDRPITAQRPIKASPSRWHRSSARIRLIKGGCQSGRKLALALIVARQSKAVFTKIGPVPARPNWPRSPTLMSWPSI